MTRLPLLVLAVAIGGLLAATLVGAASAAESELDPAQVDFRLPANHGLHAHLENSSEGITLAIERKGHYAAYRVQGEANEAGVKARFGKLGTIDVAFEPTSTELDEPPKGCTGEPSTLSEGFFVGTIEFTGEREYVRVESTRVKGRLDVWRESEWKCRRHGQRSEPQVAGRASRDAPAAEREPASLIAASRHCGCFFAAYAERSRKGRGPTTFFGARFEEREGIEITRVTYVKAGTASFVFDHAAGTATARPPRPFSGHGIFKRRPDRRDLWRSTIRVPFLGIAPVDFHGPGFRATLLRELPGD